MMKILDRYIAKTTILATALAALIITSVLMLISMLNELKSLGEGDYGILQAILYVLLRLPNELYQFSPMLILLGSIIGLSMLATHKELAVMRASGFSVTRIIISVLSTAFLLIMTISLMGEVVAPHLSYRAEVRKEAAKNGGQAVVTAAGIWLHVDNNFIHIQHVVGRQLLEGLTRYQFDENHQLKAAYYANMLSIKKDEWTLYDVVKTSFVNGQTKSEAFPKTQWDLKFNPNLLNVGLVEPNEMSLSKLLKLSRYLLQNGLHATEYQYEFWQRIFRPLASLIMIFLAIPFVLNVLSTITLGRRILIGIMFGFIFFISNAFFGQLCIVYQLPTILAASLPLVVFILIGSFLSNRLIKR